MEGVAAMEDMKPLLQKGLDAALYRVKEMTEEFNN